MRVYNVNTYLRANLKKPKSGQKSPEVPEFQEVPLSSFIRTSQLDVTLISHSSL